MYIIAKLSEIFSQIEEQSIRAATDFDAKLKLSFHENNHL